MLIVKTNPVGIDAYIHKLQSVLHDRLLAMWGVNSSQFIVYPRCYRNKTSDGYIAENYQGNANYKEVYWDDSLSAISFFGVGGTLATGSADVHLVFFVNLAKLKPAISHRADEEVRQDVTRLIGKAIHGFSFQSVELSIENVLREYPGSRRDQRLTKVDMHPTHCFRINLKLQYDPNKNCLTTSIQ